MREEREREIKIKDWRQEKKLRQIQEDREKRKKDIKRDRKRIKEGMQRQKEQSKRERQTERQLQVECNFHKDNNYLAFWAQQHENPFFQNLLVEFLNACFWSQFCV